MMTTNCLICCILGTALSGLICRTGIKANRNLLRQIKAVDRERCLIELKINEIRLRVGRYAIPDAVESVGHLLEKQEIAKANERLSEFAMLLRKALG